ncbi:hypothetical protein AaE_013920 [Aphanomyces astaci]|uniref:Uncharacterized protein n=1 Tax=Aphanomyces astaci TaxID=112090 RepID=A0A6A4ZH81_APHAT|nr:hypothetical protein AaE_013920 [Aphanomyces astaci]
MVVVVVTVLVMGGLTVKLLDVLDIKRVPKEAEGDEAVLQASTKRHVLLKWDAKYFLPWLTTLPMYDEVYDICIMDLQSIHTAGSSPNSVVDEVLTTAGPNGFEIVSVDTNATDNRHVVTDTAAGAVLT